VRITLIVGIMTVLSAGAVAVVSTSRLSAEKADSRLRLALRQTEDGIGHYLGRAESDLEQTAELAATTTVTEESRRQMQALLLRADGLYSDAYVAEGGNGLVLASLPSGEHRSSVRGLPAFADVRQGRGGFITQSSANDPQGLWFARTAVMRSGRPVVVLGKIDLGFLEDVVDQVMAGQPERAVAIMSGSHTIEPGVFNNTLALATARWLPQTSNSGRIMVESTQGTRMDGLYIDLQGL
jgi:hypothetical protein